MQEENKLYSEEVEQNILGCMLVFEDCVRYTKEIDENEFYSSTHRKIFEAIKELETNESPVEIISVKEILKNKGLEDKRILSYLVKITENIFTSTNIEYYISKLKNYSIRRQIVKEAQKIISNMYEVSSDVEAEEIKKEAVQGISDIKISSKNCSEENEMKNVIVESMIDIENKYNKRDDYRYHTGLFELDKVTDGLHEQELTLIAARPGVGKTALALKIAENISEKGICTYFVSLEMSKKQLGNRMISSKADIDSHKLRSGWLNEEDFNKIGKASGELSELKMIVDDKSSTIQEIELKACELKEKRNIGLIIIDYLQLLKSKNKFGVREQEVAEISRKLKLLSKDLNIPIIALCQLNRESLKRTRPTNADLRESGSLEQDADNIIFIYADDSAMIDSEGRAKKVIETELIISKQRNGPTGTVKVLFDKKTMTYRNIIR